MNKKELLKEVIKFKVSKSIFPDTQSMGYPNLNTVELPLIIEIIPKEYFYSTNIEFFILSSFEILKEDDKIDDPILNGLPPKSGEKEWVFYKVLFMNKNIEDLFKKNEMNKTNIIEIKKSKDSSLLEQIFLRHLSSMLHDGVKYKILEDKINFETFNLTKEIKQDYELHE